MSKNYKSLLLEQSIVDSAKILTDLDTITKRTDTVNFICKCSNTYSKVVRTLLEKSGMLCRKCTAINKEKKSVKTCLKKFGVEYASHSEELQNKRKITCMQRYGVENPFQHKPFIKKSRETCMKRYGVDYGTLLRKKNEKKEFKKIWNDLFFKL